MRSEPSRRPLDYYTLDQYKVVVFYGEVRGRFLSWKLKTWPDSAPPDCHLCTLVK